MYEQYIGKKCEAIVIFGSQALDGGSAPLHIEGILESCDNDFVCVVGKKCKSVISKKAILVLKVFD